MKRWAKILLILGIIWIVLVLAFNIALTLKTKKASGTSLGEEIDDSPFWRGMIETVTFPIAPTIIKYFFVMGIPSWVIFILVGIFGRNKKLEPQIPVQQTT